MSHDPLCPAPACAMSGRLGLLCDDCDLAHEDCRCVCGLLARARADERGRTLDAAREAVVPENLRSAYLVSLSPQEQRIAISALELAAKAIDALREEQK